MRSIVFLAVLLFAAAAAAAASVKPTAESLASATPHVQRGRPVVQTAARFINSLFSQQQGMFSGLLQPTWKRFWNVLNEAIDVERMNLETQAFKNQKKKSACCAYNFYYPLFM